MLEVIMFLATLSIASERVVEVIKNATDLTTRVPHEKTRILIVHGLAIVSGGVLAFFMAPAVTMLPAFFKTTAGYVVLGLMSGAGSSVWNSILTIITDFKTKLK